MASDSAAVAAVAATRWDVILVLDILMILIVTVISWEFFGETPERFGHGFFQIFDEIPFLGFGFVPLQLLIVLVLERAGDEAPLDGAGQEAALNLAGNRAGVPEDRAGFDGGDGVSRDRLERDRGEEIGALEGGGLVDKGGGGVGGGERGVGVGGDGGAGDGAVRRRLCGGGWVVGRLDFVKWVRRDVAEGVAQALVEWV